VGRRVAEGRLLSRASIEILFPGSPRMVAYGGANAFGFNAVIVESPADGVLIVVLSNSSPPRRLRADEVGKGLVDRLLQRQRTSTGAQ
jgi:hypothetical protein